MKTLALICSSILLAGCCTVFHKNCPPDKPDCPVVKPVVITEYVTMPDHLTTPCVRPEEVPYGTTWDGLITFMDKRKGEHNLCADKVDLIRDTNQEYKNSITSRAQHSE